MAVSLMCVRQRDNLTERAEDLNKSNTQEIGERAKTASEAEADFLKDGSSLING